MASNSAAERLFYQITVTAPGTRSQGWKGTLYSRDGQEIEVGPGQSVKTHVGEFVSIEWNSPWVPWGMIQSDVLSWMKTHDGNVIIDARRCEYRLYVSAEGSKSEGWRGELVWGDSIVTPHFERVLAPMGIFVWSENPNRWGLHGWFHEAWVMATRPSERGVGDDVELMIGEGQEKLREQLEGVPRLTAVLAA